MTNGLNDPPPGIDSRMYSRPVEETEVWRNGNNWSYTIRFWGGETKETMECTSCHNPHRQNSYRPMRYLSGDPKMQTRYTSLGTAKPEFRQGNFLNAMLFDPKRKEPNNPDHYPTEDDYNAAIFPPAGSSMNEPEGFFANPNDKGVEGNLPQNFCSYCHSRREKASVKAKLPGDEEEKLYFNHPVAKVPDPANPETLRFASLPVLGNDYVTQNEDERVGNMIYRIFNATEDAPIRNTRGIRFDFSYNVDTGKTDIKMLTPSIVDQYTGEIYKFDTTMGPTNDINGEETFVTANEPLPIYYLGGRLANYATNAAVDPTDGVTMNYQPYGGEKGGVICATCHKAHGAGYGGKLTITDFGRDEVGDPMESQLCMLCHMVTPWYKPPPVGDCEDPTGFDCLQDPSTDMNIVRGSHPVGPDTATDDDGYYRSRTSGRVLNLKIPYSWPTFAVGDSLVADAVTCMSCHDPHLAPGRPVLRIPKQRFCPECHGKKTEDINQVGNPVYYAKPGDTIAEAQGDADPGRLEGGGPASHPVYIYDDNMSAEETGLSETGSSYLYGPQNSTLKVQDEPTVPWPNECKLPIYDTDGIELEDPQNIDGLLLCTTCHHVHSGYGPALVRAPGAGMSAICVSCHTRMFTFKGDFCNLDIDSSGVAAFGANPSEYIVEYSHEETMLGKAQPSYLDGTQEVGVNGVKRGNPILEGLDVPADYQPSNADVQPEDGADRRFRRLGSHPSNKVIYAFNYDQPDAAESVYRDKFPNELYYKYTPADLDARAKNYGEFDYPRFLEGIKAREVSPLNRPQRYDENEQPIDATGNWNYMIDPYLTTYASNRKSLFGNVEIGSYGTYEMVICQSCPYPTRCRRGFGGAELRSHSGYASRWLYRSYAQQRFVAIYECGLSVLCCLSSLFYRSCKRPIHFQAEPSS